MMTTIASSIQTPVVRDLGLVDYEPTWRAMQTFTAERTPNTRDEIWLLQHYPVYTLGQRGGAEHIFQADDMAADIPVVPIDRGGLVTYHGPGQLVVYPLLDLERRRIGVRKIVTMLENTVVQLLAEYDISAAAKADAPGVYVAGKKIASIGLKVKRGCCYHGLSLNIDMDLTPFARINPCGFAGLEMVQLSTLLPVCDFADIQKKIITIFNQTLSGEKQ